jgi:hypothetical protein
MDNEVKTILKYEERLLVDLTEDNEKRLIDPNQISEEIENEKELVRDHRAMKDTFANIYQLPNYKDFSKSKSIIYDCEMNNKCNNNYILSYKPNFDFMKFEEPIFEEVELELPQKPKKRVPSVKSKKLSSIGDKLSKKSEEFIDPNKYIGELENIFE